MKRYDSLLPESERFAIAKRYVASLRTRGEERDRATTAYSIVLVGLICAAPLVRLYVLWATDAHQASWHSAQWLVQIAPLVTSLAGLALVIIGLRVPPITMSAPDAAFWLTGAFTPSRVLFRRTALMMAGFAVVGAFTWGVLAGQLTSPAGAIGVALVSMAVAIIVGVLWLMASMPRWRGIAIALTLVSLTISGGTLALQRAGVRSSMLSVLAAINPADWPTRALRLALSGGGLPTLVFGAVMLAFTAVIAVLLTRDVLDQATPWALQSAALRRSRIAEAYAAGNARGLQTALAGPRARGRGRVRFARTPGLAFVQRDLVAALRRPASTLLSLGLLAGGGFTLAVTAEPLLIALGVLLVYGGTAALSRGLRECVDRACLPPIFGTRLRVQFAAHCVLPLAAVAVTATASALFALDNALEHAPSWWIAAVTATVGVLRIWVSTNTQLPLWRQAPVYSELGDLSHLNTLAWYLRGWLVALTLPMVLGLGLLPSEQPAAWAIIIAVVAGLCLTLTLRGARRLEAAW